MAISLEVAHDVTLEFLKEYPRAYDLAYRFRENTEALYGSAANLVPSDMKGGYRSVKTPHNGQIYEGRVDVPLQNITDANDLRATLQHEVLGHYGVNTFNSLDKKSLLDGIIAASGQDSLKPVWDDINIRYADCELYVRAEEVFAFQCESIQSQQHIGKENLKSQGQQSFYETCIAKTRPMQLVDLHNITLMIVQGLHDRSREQKNFPVAGVFRLASNDLKDAFESNLSKQGKETIAFRHVLEQSMAEIVKNMPSDLQEQTKQNFYQNQITELSNMAKPSQQTDMELER